MLTLDELTCNKIEVNAEIMRFLIGIVGVQYDSFELHARYNNWLSLGSDFSFALSSVVRENNIKGSTC